MGLEFVTGGTFGYGFSALIDNVKEAAQGNRVQSGCAGAEKGTPDMSVDIASGTVEIAGAEVDITGVNKAVNAADGTNDRYDIIYVGGDATVDYVAGTAAANPVPPDLPADHILLCVVFVENNSTTVVNADIFDSRVINEDVIVSVDPAFHVSNPFSFNYSTSGTAPTVAAQSDAHVRATRAGADGGFYGFRGVGAAYPSAEWIGKIGAVANGQVGLTDNPYSNNFALFFYDGAQKVINNNGGPNTVTAESTDTWTNETTFKIVQTNTPNCKFYTNGVLRVTHTTNIYAGTDLYFGGFVQSNPGAFLSFKTAKVWFE